MSYDGRVTVVRKENASVPVGPVQNTGQSLSTYYKGCLHTILRNTITGIDFVAANVLEAASGMGITPFQVLTQVEIPLFRPVVLAGIHISTVINIGTAILGATIGTGGFGKPIIAGLVCENPALIIEWAILVCLFAIIVDIALGMLGGKRGSRVFGSGVWDLGSGVWSLEETVP